MFHYRVFLQIQAFLVSEVNRFSLPLPLSLIHFHAGLLMYFRSGVDMLWLPNVRVLSRFRNLEIYFFGTNFRMWTI